MKYIVANWKAQKSLNDVQSWLQVFKKEYKAKDGLSVCIASSFPHLQFVRESIKDLPNCFVAAQSISEKSKGSFTGEVTAQALVGMVQYCIVGHSERRIKGETKEQIDAQIINLKEQNISPILCISSVDEFPQGYTGLIAYEQPEDIGTGQGTAIERVMSFYKSLNLSSDSTFLYGASVDKDNCLEYLEHPEIKGFIVGTASLDPDQFIKIVEKI